MKKSFVALLIVFVLVLAVALGINATRGETAEKTYQAAENSSRTLEPSVAIESPKLSGASNSPEPSRIPETQKPTEETVEVKTTEPPKLATDREIELIARTIWGEAEVVDSTAERAAVAWCILNRVDDSGNSIESVILAPYQFYCREDGNVPAWAVELAEDVVGRWEREHAGEKSVGRTLPADYLYFIGDGWHNHFSIEWRSTDYWDWSLPDPYKT